MPNVKLFLPVTPPSPIGTCVGGHIYVEDPDQSAAPSILMDGATLMNGSGQLQGQWAPIDCGLIPYKSAEQPWIVEYGSGGNERIAHDVRVYVSSYSDTVDLPLVRYGLTGATPSFVVTVPAITTKKPNSGSNITPYLVTSISGSVSAAVSVSGKLRRPIGITVSLAGLPVLSTRWAYQLLGFQDGDITQSPVLASGVITDTTGGLIPAGPDGITIAHTFGPEEPTAPMNITVYAVAGLIAADRYIPGLPPHTPGSFIPNNIVPGITASCIVSIGTTGGVIDMTNVLLTSTSAEFHIDPDTGKWAMNAVDFTKATNFSTQFVVSAGAFRVDNLAANLIVTGALQVGGPSMVSQVKIFDTSGNLIGWVGDDTAVSGFVGAWYKRLLIGGTSPATAKIVADSSGNVSISGTLISGNISGNSANITGTLTVSQIGSGTLPAGVGYAQAIAVSQLTAGTVTVASSGTALLTIKYVSNSLQTQNYPGLLVGLT